SGERTRCGVSLRIFRDEVWYVLRRGVPGNYTDLMSGRLPFLWRLAGSGISSSARLVWTQDIRFYRPVYPLACFAATTSLRSAYGIWMEVHPTADVGEPHGDGGDGAR